ncbi:MAG: hypothetical protein N2448_03250 [Caloramator sp.]|nr:hypothetical protein [Caloramator sp.]
MLSVILSCFGRYELIENSFSTLLNELEKIRDEIELIVVLDNKIFFRAPIVQSLKIRFNNCNIFFMDEETNLPSKLFNKGIQEAKNEYLIFIWPGCDFVAEDFNAVKTMLYNKNDRKDVYYIKREKHDSLSFYPPETLQYGWNQCLKVYELNDLLIRKTAFDLIGGFDESKLLQKYSDWDFILRLTRNYILFEIHSKNTINEYNFVNYPYNYHYNFSKDLIHRFIIRNINYNYDNTKNREEDFLNDISDDYKNTINKKIGCSFKEQLTNYNKLYNIVIVCGYWEYIHNQLCFYNFFDKLYGRGFGTYKVVFDFMAATSDLKNADLVIFSRARSNNILNLIEYCKDKSIKTMYMIDDNWLWVGKDWPDDYGEIFKPGKPDYDNFIYAISSVDGVMVYNDYLQQDILKYTNKVYKFPVNINLEFYKPSYKQYYDKLLGDNVIIGYTGSLRYDNSAFLALSEATKYFNNLKVLLFGIITEEQRKLFDEKKIVSINYRSYFEYCKIISSIKPLALIAPLDKKRTSMSKCPNKYLEFSAVGSVGIYSDVYPYSYYVKDQINGLLVKNNVLNEWLQKICMVIENPKLSQKIVLNSKNDVLNNFSTDKVIEDFISLLNNIILN